MATKNLCRLCAKKFEFAKDLRSDDNRSLINFINTFLKIELNVRSMMPTKVCLNCEEKLLSFQMFVLECEKVQKTLQDLIAQELNLFDDVKQEIFIDDTSIVQYVQPECDVKMESALEAKEEHEQHSTLSDFVDSVNNDDSVCNDDDDFSDDTLLIHISSKKKIKKNAEPCDKKDKKLEIRDQQMWNPDLLNYACHLCESDFGNWNKLKNHTNEKHQTKPVIKCSCGVTLRKRCDVVEHIREHKDKDLLQTKKIKNDDNNAAFNLKIHDFIRFICLDCEREFSSWYTLKSHTQRIHKKAPLVQCVCGLFLKSKSVMYKHVRDHKTPSDLACDKCSKVATSVEALEKHKLRHVPKDERRFSCNVCNRQFTSKDGLKSHSRIHIPIDERKIYKCDYCNLKFTTKSSAVAHQRIVHEKIKSYVCDLCGYSCGTGGELRQHKAIHSEEKPFVCSTCNKPFKTYSNLKTHTDTHEATSYPCHVCNRVLNSKRTLRKHLLVHEERCRHFCSYCNKAFKRRQTLKVHLYTHTGDKPLSCRWCTERFAYASTLRSHRLRCHPDKLQNNTNPPQENTYIHQPLMLQENFVKGEINNINYSKQDGSGS